MLPCGTPRPTLALIALSILVHFCRTRTTEASLQQKNQHLHGAHQGHGDHHGHKRFQKDWSKDEAELDSFLERRRDEDGSQLRQEIFLGPAFKNEVLGPSDPKISKRLVDPAALKKKSKEGEPDHYSLARLNPLLDLYSSLTSQKFPATKEFIELESTTSEDSSLDDPGLKKSLDPLPLGAREDQTQQDSTLDSKKKVFGNQTESRLFPIGAIHDIKLDQNDTHHFYWRILSTHPSSEDTPSATPAAVRCEVHSRRDSPLPWIAVGFSDRGKLLGADLCVFWTDWKKQVHFQSALVDKRGRMVLGPPGVCRGFRYRKQKGVLKFTFYRELDTCEPGHYVIERGTTHVVWSYGSGPLYQLAGVLAGGDQTGAVMVELLKPPVVHDQPRMEPHRELRVMSDKVAVPDADTTYWCTVQRLPDAFERKHHVLQYSPAIQPGNEDIVHHMEVFHCEYPPDTPVPLYEGPCHASDRAPEVDACKRVLAAWAMGATPFTYPPEAGLPVGGADFNPFVMLEVHYNNVDKVKGRIDSSGMSLMYTALLRPNDASIMELGLEYTEKMAVPPRALSFMLSGYCVPECTALGVPPSGIYIFGSQLHTHLTGVRAWTKHYREGRELPELNRDNHYSTHFQEIRRLPRPVQVLPGDSLVMTCEYSTPHKDGATIGGFAISDEMCINYVHYFPKVELEVCKSSIDTDSLSQYFGFMREYELQKTSSDKGWRDNYHSIQWTPLRNQFLAELYDTAPLSMQCNRSNGERFPGYWDNIQIPKVLHELPVLERKCENAALTENAQFMDSTFPDG